MKHTGKQIVELDVIYYTCDFCPASSYSPVWKPDPSRTEKLGLPPNQRDAPMDGYAQYREYRLRTQDFGALPEGWAHEPNFADQQYSRDGRVLCPGCVAKTKAALEAALALPIKGATP